MLRQCERNLAGLPVDGPPSESISPNPVCTIYENRACVQGDIDPLTVRSMRITCFDDCDGFRTDQWIYSSSEPRSECNSDVANRNSTQVVNSPSGCVLLFETQAMSFRCRGGCTNEPTCFSEESQVKVLSSMGSETPTESIKLLKDLVAGDLVESFDVNGKRRFVPLIRLEHSSSDIKERMLMLYYSFEDALTGKERGMLRVTPSHLLVGDDGQSLVAAGDIVRGDSIWVMTSDGFRTKAEIINIQAAMGRVLNPVTDNMRVVVDGVLASSWSDVKVAGIRLAELPFSVVLPLRVLARLGMYRTVDVLDELVHKIASLVSSFSF
eukprot:CAMPEP_0182442284 /NCGR_PEP_ID=MMETSP1172-20130603/1213_1 /TAXON_ID=708627 /ORGANISM="Timspurckia oligopyrenoides, Strain CCMP3278" /LENGTH=323 /DNA_ID=CAMNT_0024637055 /DNA_START=156 /DNA_END=1127 /DNA_ORIENTATION=+